jgi:hypothetical protein
MKGNCSKLHRWDGSALALIKDRVSLTDPERTREIIEKDLTLDCDGSGGSGTQEKSPGTETIGDIQIEVIYDPAIPEVGPPEITNDHNHDLIVTDFDNETATFWLIEYPDGTGVAIHAFVSEVGSAEITPNEEIKKTFTITPTGAEGGFIRSNDIVNETLPATPAAPVNYYSS